MKIDIKDLKWSPKFQMFYKGILIKGVKRSTIEEIKNQSPDIYNIPNYMDRYFYNIIIKEYNEHISVIRDKKIDDILK